jgi:hypothetical protein
MLKTLALLLVAFANFLGSAFAAPATITKDTYAVLDQVDIPIFLKQDDEGKQDQTVIAALVKQHRCILVPKGTTGMVITESQRVSPRVILFEPDNSNVPFYISPTSVSIAGKTLEEEAFHISDLPRVPIHTPKWQIPIDNAANARQEVIAAANQYVYNYNQSHPRNPMEGLSSGDTIYHDVYKAIMNMLHLTFGADLVTAFDRSYSIVCYGPVPDGDYWYCEVQFRLTDETGIFPRGKIWTAVIRESQSHRAADGVNIEGEIFTCELGADTPTLKDRQLPPPPADKVKAHEERDAIQRILHPLGGLYVPPKIEKGEVTILEDTLGIADDGVKDVNIDEFKTLITAQYLDDTKGLDSLFEKGKGHYVLIKKGTRVMLENDWPYQGREDLSVLIHGHRSHTSFSGKYYILVPLSAVFKEFSHPATYVPKSDDWIISNESQEYWLKFLATPNPTPTSTPQELPEAPITPVIVPTPTPNERGELTRELGSYDQSWRWLPDECKIKLHDEEVQFRESLKSLDDRNKIQRLEERITYLAKVTREANTPKPTPNPNTIAHTIRPSTPEESAEESTLRKEYSAIFMALPASTRRQLHDAEVDFDVKTRQEDGAARNADLQERIKYFKNLVDLDSENLRNSATNNPTPVSTPVSTPQPSAQTAMNFLAQEYDKMWEAAYAAQLEPARVSLRDEEVAFRASLKGLDPNAVLQKITKRMIYFQSLSMKLPPVPPLTPTKP